MDDFELVEFPLTFPFAFSGMGGARFKRDPSGVVTKLPDRPALALPLGPVNVGPAAHLAELPERPLPEGVLATEAVTVHGPGGAYYVSKRFVFLSK